MTRSQPRLAASNDNGVETPNNFSVRRKLSFAGRLEPDE
jgi:hypothetical protein